MPEKKDHPIVRGCDEPDWPRAVRDALTSVLVDDRVVPQDRPEPLARMIGDIVTTLGQLLAGSSLAVRRVWYEDCVDIGGDRLGAVGRALLVQAIIFGFGHVLVNFEVQGFSRILPGLAFGWLYARTRSVFAGTLFHAACNIVMELLVTTYYR